MCALVTGVQTCALPICWKFDNYVRADRPTGLDPTETYALWSRIACPTLLVRGMESWASDPEKDGRATHFRNARVANIAGAGHWVHHDRLDERSEEHTSELQSLMRISYAVFCLKKKNP